MRCRVRPERTESGSTLIEVLMAVAIMGLAFVVIVGGIATAILGADHHRAQTTASVALRNAAEKIMAAPYSPGATTLSYSPLAAAAGVAVESVTCLNEATNSFDQNCDSSGPGSGQDTGVQLITVTAVSTTSRPVTRTLQFVKRQP